VHPVSGHEGGWGGSACIRAVVLQPAVTEADGGGSVRACGWGTHPCQLQFDLIEACVGRRCNNIYLFKNVL
jgi:hypothetical protein